MTDDTHYVTPEEAMNKGCVMSMARENPHTIYQFCLGPQCMAWRWRYEDRTWVNDGHGYGHWEFIKKTHGYCGTVRS